MHAEPPPLTSRRPIGAPSRKSTTYVARPSLTATTGLIKHPRDGSRWAAAQLIQTIANPRRLINRAQFKVMYVPLHRTKRRTIERQPGRRKCETAIKPKRKAIEGVGKLGRESPPSALMPVWKLRSLCHENVVYAPEYGSAVFVRTAKKSSNESFNPTLFWRI
jgi:hypothetical protein